MIQDADLLVRIGGAVTVAGLDATSSLIVDAGGSLTLKGSSTVRGGFTVTNGRTLRADGPDVVVEITGNTVANGANLYAVGGATLSLPGLTNYTAGSANAIYQWRTEGAGSVLELPNLSSISGGTHSWGGSGLAIQTMAGGRVELPILTEVSQGRVIFLADGEDSRIDMPVLSSINGTHGTSTVEARNGGTIQVGTLVAETSVRAANINVDSTGNLITNRFVLGSVATLRGTGTFFGSVTNGGTVQPGSGIGTLTVDGDFVQLPSGILQIEVGGSTAPTQADLLQVTGTATLDGTVQVLRVGTALPSLGQELSVLQANEVLGAFSAFNGLALGSGGDSGRDD